MNEITSTNAELAAYLKGLQAIVFDLDDTLYLQKDFKISGFQAVATWMAHNGYGHRHVILKELLEILEHFGPSYPFMFDRLLERTALPTLILPELIQVFNEHNPEIALFPGVQELLSNLRKKFKLGILTDGRLSVQQAKIRSLKLESLMDCILYSDTLGMVKPAEPLFKWFENYFQLQGPSIAYVADNPIKDFSGAKKRRWITIRVLSGEHAKREANSGNDAEFTLPRIDCLCCPYLPFKERLQQR